MGLYYWVLGFGDGAVAPDDLWNKQQSCQSSTQYALQCRSTENSRYLCLDGDADLRHFASASRLYDK